MAIKFFTDKIQIGDYNLFEGNGGIQFDGVARAENFEADQRFQGSISGYRSGGYGPGAVAVIEKFSFTTNSNATSVGNLTQGRYGGAGCQSSFHGYTAGGRSPTVVNTIDKFPFATDTNSNDVGDLETPSASSAGCSSQSNGYAIQGTAAPGGALNQQQKFNFATDSNAVNYATSDLNGNGAPQSSDTHGYSSGESPASLNIGKFPFAVDTKVVDVGDLTQSRSQGAGVSSTTHGYTVTGYTPPGATGVNTIDKFPFASDGNATDVGDVTQAVGGATGHSSIVFGYRTAGDLGPARSNTIDKFPFATDTNATDVGDLIAVRSLAAGHQH